MNPWSIETMRIINALAPEVKGKAFDPDWFLLRQRFEQVDEMAKVLQDCANAMDAGFDSKPISYSDAAHTARAILEKINK
jgi:hypothetical protein